ncbi:MAG: hypothetical protein HKN76_10600 [Saprospiraceae bacterium]|nr:hypothetical protein [Saprospiraceae bacterium]
MKYSAIHQVFRLIIAVIIGEIILVLGTTFVQETIFGGISWYESGAFEILVGGFGSFLAAVVSGAVAYAVMKHVKAGPVVILSFLVVVETVWLISNEVTDGPLWFDLLGSGTLIAGLWVGRWAMKMRGITEPVD